MVYRDKGKKGGRSIVCDKAHRHVGCHLASWKTADFERSVLSSVREINAAQLSGDFVHVGALADLGRRIEAAQGRLTAEQTRRQRIFDLLTTTPATDFTKKQFEDADVKVASLQRELDDLQHQAERMRSENAGFTEGSQSLIELLEGTMQEPTENRRMVRMRLRAALHSLIEGILVFPLGPSFRRPGHSEGTLTIEDEKGTVDVRGNVGVRYGPLERDRRMFVIVFKNGTRRRVKPSIDNAMLFDWMGEDGCDPITREQVMEMARIWGMDPFDRKSFEAAHTRLRGLTDDDAGE